MVASVPDEAVAAADVAFRSLGKRRAFVVNDNSSLGQVLGSSFAGRFSHDGGKVVDQASADVLYFPGADLTAAAALRQQMARATPSVPLIGAEPLSNGQFARSAGTAARGSYYALVGCDPAHTSSAAAFVRNYQRQFGRQPSNASLAAFDAAGVIINAVERAIDDAGGAAPTRQQVLNELSRTNNYSGASGSFGFDAHGDTTLRWVSVYQWLAPTDRSGRFLTQLAVG